MIGSFWNLCRCTELHSEYRSTYRWHEFSGPEVVRKPPVPNQFELITERKNLTPASSKDHFFSKSTENEKLTEAVTAPVNEPPLPRRKKNPELAYRSHEFIGAGADRTDSVPNRARSGERQTPSRRSKSEGPPAISNGRCVSGIGHDDTKPAAKAGESNGLFKKTIEKLSTEYRIQFVWPSVRRAITGGSAADVADPPRKSISMGAIKSAHTYNIPTVHKKRTTNEKEAAAHELEPLFREDAAGEKKAEHVSEKRHIRPNYQFDKEKFGFEPENHIKVEKLANGHAGMGYDKNWLKDVIELRKRAGEYKTRAWGVEINPDLVKKQAEVFDQISRRSSLSALSLDTSIRPKIDKAKDEVDNKKCNAALPPKPKIPGLESKLNPDGILIRAKLDNVRYHLGKEIESNDIALLISPTREKLMPAIPKGSPQKTAKGLSPRSSPKKRVKVRSQSVGPTVSDRSGSPKKQIRSGSTVSASNSTKPHKRTPASTPTVSQPDGPGRRPRPTTLSATNQSRKLKSRSLPPSSRVITAPPSSVVTSNASYSLQIKNQLNLPLKMRNKNAKNHAVGNNKDHVPNYLKKTQASALKGMATPRKNQDRKTAETDDEHVATTTTIGPSPLPHPDVEHIIKSPPEPTRVKSPEQILMRSPDPVNWTVPLDTGKTFTVTQNVREGDTSIRPHSDLKASTPLGNAPTAFHAANISAINASSAPPSLEPEQSKLMSTNMIQQKSDKLDLSATTSTVQPAPKPHPGTSIRCLDDPVYSALPDTLQPPANIGRYTATNEVVEEARDRFDRYWSKPDATTGTVASSTVTTTTTTTDSVSSTVKK